MDDQYDNDATFSKSMGQVLDTIADSDVSKGIQYLFGENPSNLHDVIPRYSGHLITTSGEGISVPATKLYQGLQSLVRDTGVIHPHDSTFRQVPAKLLLSSNGELRIIIKGGIEFVFDYPMSERTMKVIVNEVVRTE